jgi:urease gamma subunit
MEDNEMNKELTKDDLINIMESTLKAQLRELRHLRGCGQRGAHGVREGSAKKSNMSLIKDILTEAKEPLHINDIIDRARKKHSVKLNRESVVSAMTKKILDGRDFRRAGRNVFALIGRGGN